MLPQLRQSCFQTTTATGEDPHRKKDQCTINPPHTHTHKDTKHNVILCQICRKIWSRRREMVQIGTFRQVAQQSNGPFLMVVGSLLHDKDMHPGSNLCLVVSNLFVSAFHCLQASACELSAKMSASLTHQNTSMLALTIAEEGPPHHPSVLKQKGLAIESCRDSKRAHGRIRILFQLWFE